MGSKIFISYSQKDKKYCSELVRALKAVHSLHDRVWIDDRQHIEFGEQVDEVIREGLADSALAILLVSEHSLAPDGYVMQRELPFLLCQAECKALRLGICYVSRVAEAALSVVVDIDSQPRSFPLGKISSFNRHDTNPLRSIENQDGRNAIYVAAVDWAVRQLRPSPPPLRRASGARPELAVFIEARPDHWQHQYFPGTHATAIRPRIDCLAPALTFGFDLDGKVLFELLFGSDPAKFGHLFAAAFDTDGPAEPTLGPLRVRLLTANEQLRRLPWATIAYQGRVLSQVGWTVELHVPPRDPGFPDYPRHRCQFPGRLLLAGSTQTRQAAHFDDLRHFFQRHWPQNPEPALAADADALRRVLEVGSTRLVYYYGPASRKGLLLQDGTDSGNLSWAELARCLQESRSVSLLFLNLVNEAGDEALADAPLLLDGVKGAVLFQCNPRASAHAAAKAGLAWLAAVFLSPSRTDPVAALHQHGCGHISAWTRYSTWETVAPARLQHPDLVNLLLDRHDQRHALSGARDEFHTYPARRIHHVVALGTPGCRTSDFPQMIKQHLVGNKREREAYCYQAVELTPGIATLQQVDDLVRRRFRLNPRQSLLDGLLDREALAGTAFCFLVLGWQAGSADDNAARLLRVVTEWCRMRLAAELGTGEWQDKVRVISIIALEAVRTEGLTSTVDDLIEEHDVEAGFHFGELKALGAVRRQDLRNYFRNEAVCGCDERYRETFPDLLLGPRKEMPFDEAVSTIRRGEPDNWGNLFDELKDLKQSGAWPPPHDDANFWSPSDAR
jgi:hypothetical protein